MLISKIFFLDYNQKKKIEPGWLSYSCHSVIYIKPLLSESVLTADCSCRGAAVSKRPQGNKALNGESAAHSQVHWVSKGHSQAKVTSVQSSNYIIRVCLRLWIHFFRLTVQAVLPTQRQICVESFSWLQSFS